MLTVVQVRAATATERKIRLWDAQGLYLEVTPTGSKYWRLKYRVGGKEKVASFGTYPQVALAEARACRDKAKALLRAGKDPNAVKAALVVAQASAALATFGTVRKAWLADFKAREALPRGGGRVAPITSATAGLHLAKAAALDHRPIAEITPAELITIIKPIELAGNLETAKRVRQRLGDVFAFAVRRGLLRVNPVTDLKNEFQPPRATHHAAIIDPPALAQLLRGVWGYQGSLVVMAALRLAALTFVRPGELRRAEWSEFDLDAATWIIPAARMKGGLHDHIVPLSSQALATLRDLHKLTGGARYVFPGGRSNGRPMSENAVNAALRGLGYDTTQMTGHGFRTVASTILNELGVASDYIERQLAHVPRNAVRAAYNRAQHLPERRAMMQHYSDFLDALRCGGSASPDAVG